MHLSIAGPEKGGRRRMARRGPPESRGQQTRLAQPERLRGWGDGDWPLVNATQVACSRLCRPK
jgi:hypothetical protein